MRKNFVCAAGWMLFFQGLISLLGVGAIAGSTANGDQPPNVLLIAVDDLKTIGTLYADEQGSFLKHIYPDQKTRTEVVQRMTPNIQRLADRGVRFMDAYCAAPACNPSRAALMTGIRPATSGLTTNAGGVFFRDYEYEGKKPLADAVTLPELLKANGWYTGATGKIFHSGSSFAKSDGNRSWTAWTNVRGDAGKKTRDRFSPKSLDWGREGDESATFESLNDVRKAKFIAQVLRDGKAIDGANRFELDQRPFFLACGIFRPHLPFYATQDLLNLFPPEEMTVRRELLTYFLDDAGDLPEQAYGWCGLSVDANGHPKIGKDRFVDILNHGKRVDGKDGDLAGWKQMLQHYFASCAIADRAIGKLLDGLDAGPYRENTMIILWSDHGYHLGEKLHETKFTLWDAGANVNLIICDPRHRKQAGKRCDQPVSLIDLFPTVAKMAGIESMPDQLILGQDLEPLLANPDRPRKEPVLTTYRTVKNHMLRTERFKLIRYDDDDASVELYDMRADPEEYRNLAASPDHESTLAELIEMMDSELAASTP